MREQQLVLPFGGLSMRKFFLFVTAIFVATFAFLLAWAPPAHSQATPAANAEWNGSSIMYNQRQYIAIADAKAGDSHNLPVGSKIYAYIEPTNSSPSSPTKKAHLIYFAPGTDPSTATSANFATYDFTPPSTYANPSGATTITITPTSGSNPGTTSCDSTFTMGIGWIVCPITNFLASAMDWLFDILSSFLAVRPVQSNQETALYRAWSFARNFANVAFVMGFLVIIYSQLSNVGLSNYNIKKMLPRLIAAAILVNISYWICAVAIDASNILGYSIQDIFITMRNSLIGTEGNNWDVVSWKSIGGFILSGGTAAVGAGIATHAILAGTVGGALYLLLPILVGVLMAVLVALLVMAARQAIITVLVIVSPLAFVAFLLPNTEKYFDKWKDLLTTMLVMFPLFSVIFGGSQLAGVVIIQNADSINLIILGMAVQVAPVVVTPLLVRFSGSLLGRIAGMVNNPNKGIIDRTRNWSKERAEQHKARALANLAKRDEDGLPRRRRDGLARVTQSIDRNKRKREGWLKANQSIADNGWHGSKEYAAIDMATRDAERSHKILEQQHEAHWNKHTRLNARALEQELKLRVTADEVSAAKIRLDAAHEEFKAGHAPAYGPRTASMAALLDRSTAATQDLALTALRKQAAERTQKAQLTEDLLKNTATIDGTTLREYGGGIRGTEGANSVLASTVAAYREEYGKHIGEKNELLRHFNLSTSDTQTLAMGTDVSKEKNGITYTFRADDEYAREAAISAQMKAGSESDKLDLIRESGKTVDAAGNVIYGKTYEYRTTIQADITANSLPSSSLITGSKTINDVGQGNVYGDTGLNNAAVYHIMEGKIRDDVLAVQGAGTLKILYETWDNRHSIPQYVNASPEKQAAFEANYQALRRSATKILRDEVNRNASEAARQVFEEYKGSLPEDPTES